MIFKGLGKSVVLSFSLALLVACGSNEVIEEEQDVVPEEPEVVEEVIEETGPTPEELAAERDRQFRETRVVNFDFDMSNVRGEYDELLAAHGRFIANNPDLRVTVEGHADERGTPEYNIALGERRANSVIEVLKSYGGSASQFEAISYGEEKPVNFGHDEAAWEENRRAEIKY